MDAFALLREPRRPWIDPGGLEERFLRLSATTHPDRFHQAPHEAREEAAARYAEFNTAYQRLRDSRSRVQHLIELECGGKSGGAQAVPDSAIDLFSMVGEALRGAEMYLVERDRQTSALLKARLAKGGLEWVDRLQGIQDELRALNRDAEERLRGLNAAWEACDGIDGDERRRRLPLANLQEVYWALSFAQRWGAQIEDRLVRLAI